MATMAGTFPGTESSYMQFPVPRIAVQKAKTISMRTEVQPASQKRPVNLSPSSPRSGNKTLASDLFAAIIEFWDYMLRQDLRTLKSSPGNPSGDRDQSENKGFANSTSAKAGHGAAKVDDVTVGAQKLTSLNMTKFMLNEERDRLCLWNSNFEEGELDQLISSQSCNFGSAVIGSLLNIATAFLEEADMSRLDKHGEAIEHKLRSLIRQGKEWSRSLQCEDSADDGVSMRSGVPDVDERPKLLDVLKIEIRRLQRLGFSINLVLAQMHAEV